MPTAPAPGPLLTIREASRATGLSIKAMRGRVERGTLVAVTVGGRRRIPLSELLRAGLLLTETPAQGVRPASRAYQGTPTGYPDEPEGVPLEVVLQRLDEVTQRLADLSAAVERVERAVEPSSRVDAKGEREPQG
jgi:hypothetical protein